MSFVFVFLLCQRNHLLFGGFSEFGYFDNFFQMHSYCIKTICLFVMVCVCLTVLTIIIYKLCYVTVILLLFVESFDCLISYLFFFSFFFLPLRFSVCFLFHIK